MGDPKGFMKHNRRAPQLLPVDERIEHHEEHYEKLSDEMVRTQASRCMDCGVPFCMTGCPWATSSPSGTTWCTAANGKTPCAPCTPPITSPNSPAASAPHPAKLLRPWHQRPPVTIKLHEVSIVDRGFEQGWIKPIRPDTQSGKTVGIIGGGPAGWPAPSSSTAPVTASPSTKRPTAPVVC